MARIFIYLSLGLILQLFSKAGAQSTSTNYVTYSGQDVSSINWEEVDPDIWLDFEEWKYDLKKREADPLLITKRRDNQFRELMGKVVSCINECRIYRGNSYVNASYRSSIREGDEIHTKDNSYAWVFLLDGTLVRLSPNSSISLLEIDIGREEIFIYARFNEGFFYWLSRVPRTFEEANINETDSLFLPLRMYEANWHFKKKGNLSDSELAQYLDQEETHLLQAKRLNETIRENNKIFAEKTTYSLLVMPNGSVFGRDLRFQAFVQWSSESYIKQKKKESILEVEEKAEEKAEEKDEVEGKEENELDDQSAVSFYFRGYQNKEVFNLEEDKWYKIEPQGKKIEEYEGGTEFNFQEFLTTRIPTILYARELMLKKYSLPFFDKSLSEEELALYHGHRLWNNPINEGQDDKSAKKKGGAENKEAKELREMADIGNLNRRLKFLIEYTRRIETTNLFSTFSLLKRKYGIKLPVTPGYTSNFHDAALDHYQKELEKNPEDSDLHSTHQKIWEMKNAAGNP